MYLLYLDESGVPDLHSDQTSHYVLVGLAVHVGTWFALTRLVDGLKARFSLGDPAKFELHTAWIQKPYKEQDEIPGFADLGWKARYDAVDRWRRQRQEGWPGLKGSQRQRESRYFRLTEPYSHLTRPERNDLVDRALEIVGNYRKEIYLFGEAIDKKALSPEVDAVDQAFTQVVSRFELFLRNRSQRGSPVWGLLVVDHDPHKAGRFTRMLQRFQKQGTRWTTIDRVIEAPFFLDSSTNQGVQVVDLCAYSLRRYLENGEEKRFLTIFPKFYRTSRSLHGLRHYTQRGCPCLICQERGHHT